MAKDDLIQVEGKIKEKLGGGTYKVLLESGQEVLTKLCGKMRRFHISVVVGDQVTVGISPYDLTHGLILFRLKGGGPRPAA